MIRVQQVFEARQCRLFFFLAAAMLGGMTILGFAPFRYYFLVPVFLGIFFLLLQASSGYAARVAYGWGLGFFTVHCYWIEHAISVFGGVPHWLAIFITLLLPLYLALYPMLTVKLTELFQVPYSVRLICIFPLIWVVMDYLREHLFTGFGWGTLGYSQAVESPLIGYATIGGILLVTYVLVLLSTLVFYAFVEANLLKKLVSGLMIFLLLGGGYYLRRIDFTHFNGSTTPIGVVQLNVSQEVKFNLENRRQVLQVVDKLMRKYPEVSILFFPETSIPIPWEALSEAERKGLMDAVHRYQTSLALGLLRQVGVDYYNAIMGIDVLAKTEDLQTLPFYAKHHLVPFGEYKPLGLISNYIFNWLGISYGELTPGPTKQKVIPLAQQNIAFNICYEEGFGDELVELASNSSLIVNATNMAWYGSSYAMDLQLQQGQARAVELGRYVVRSTNTGYSAIIDNKGKIIQVLPRDQFGILIGEVKGYSGQTPYMRMGGSRTWILWITFGLLLLFLYSQIKAKVVNRAKIYRRG